MSNLKKLADEIKAQSEREKRERELEAITARSEQEFITAWERVAWSWNFAILKTDNPPPRKQFFSQGEKHFRELGALLVEKQWDKYLPAVIAKITQDKDREKNKLLYLANILVMACNPQNKKCEISKALEVASKWPSMPTDMIRDLYRNLAELHHYSGKLPEISQKTLNELTEKNNSETPRDTWFVEQYVAIGTDTFHKPKEVFKN